MMLLVQGCMRHFKSADTQSVISLERWEALALLGCVKTLESLGAVSAEDCGESLGALK